MRLSGLGAAFLAAETPTTPMHVAAVALLDASAAPGFGLAAVRTLVERRLHLLGPLRQRVVEVPFGLGRPVTADDPGFALDDHLHAAAVPAPGGPAELAGVVARILATPLPRDRPLWELHVVEGVDDGRVAVVAKMHHAVVDGLAGSALLLRLFDAEPRAEPHAESSPPGAQPWAPGPLPVPADLLAAAVADLAGTPEAVLLAAHRTLAASASARRTAARPSPPAPFTAPRTPLNASLTPRRVVAWADLPLDAVKEVKQAFGCTVTDVVLAVCASALRTHLTARGPAPARDLVALVPLALAGFGHTAGTTTTNHLAPVLVSLATTVDDPVERLRAIAASSAGAKAREGPLGPGVVQAWLDAAVPAVMTGAARLVTGMRLAERLPPACNVIVSNVPGPPFPLHLAGARVDALVPFGPLVDGVALNVTVLSNAGRLHTGVVADPAAVPDVAGVARLLAPGLGELEAAGRREGHC